MTSEVQDLLRRCNQNSNESYYVWKCWLTCKNLVTNFTGKNLVTIVSPPRWWLTISKHLLELHGCTAFNLQVHHLRVQIIKQIMDSPLDSLRAESFTWKESGDFSMWILIKMSVLDGRGLAIVVTGSKRVPNKPIQSQCSIHDEKSRMGKPGIVTRIGDRLFRAAHSAGSHRKDVEEIIVLLRWNSDCKSSRSVERSSEQLVNLSERYERLFDGPWNVAWRT